MPLDICKEASMFKSLIHPLASLGIFNVRHCSQHNSLSEGDINFNAKFNCVILKIDDYMTLLQKVLAN